MKAVEDGLRRLDGVERLETDLQRNLVTITPSPDVAVDLAAIPQSIEHSGFRPGRLWIVADGEAVETARGARAFRIRNWPQPIPLEAAATPESRVFEVVHENSTLALRPGGLPDAGG